VQEVLGDGSEGLGLVVDALNVVVVDVELDVGCSLVGDGELIK
jgi:hypothetical protein